jgi:hypothetical protein
MGYPTHRVSRMAKAGLRRNERLFPPKVQLAMTAALEHYTAALAETLLSDPRAQALLGESEVRSMLLWHALEESEHKAVAYDVYKTMGGGEFMRIFIMVLTDLLFIGETGIMLLISLLKDPTTWRHPLKVLRSFARLPKQPFMSMRALRILAEYHKPGFHPNDRDTTQLIAEWRQALFGRDGQLTEVLAG